MISADDRIAALRSALEFIHGELSKAGEMPNENAAMRALSSLEIFQVRRDGTEPRDLSKLSSAAQDIVGRLVAVHGWSGDPDWLLRRLAQEYDRL